MPEEYGDNLKGIPVISVKRDAPSSGFNSPVPESRSVTMN
jgi:hypothetical protein